MAESPWDLLLAGERERAFAQFRDAYLKEGTPSHIMELGVAYLWDRDYQAAWEHFNSVILRYPNSTDIFYGMSGVAQWCLNDWQGAVQQWRAGLECRFADGAGGVDLPLLLFFASIVKPAIIERDEPLRLLATRMRDGRSEIWPGALAEFVLGEIDFAGLRRRCVGYNDSDTLLRIWVANFYIGLNDYARGDLASYQERMRATATTSADDFDITKKHYLGKLWHSEFFIARGGPGCSLQPGSTGGIR